MAYDSFASLALWTGHTGVYFPGMYPRVIVDMTSRLLGTCQFDTNVSPFLTSAVNLLPVSSAFLRVLESSGCGNNGRGA
jgi:hypothetical protein